MKHTKVIVDSYVLAGDSLTVEGRYNHASSCDVDIERSFDFELLRANHVDQPFRDGFELVSEPAYNREVGLLALNYDIQGETTLETNKNAVNRTIDSLKYQPLGSQNSYECFPKEQAILVPYLCDATMRRNNNFYNPSSKKIIVKDNPAVEESIWYDPSYFGDIFISTYANGSADNNAQHRYNIDGLVNRDLVRFAGEEDGLIPVTYNSATDTVTCAPAYVDIHDSVFVENVDVYHRFTFAQALFTIGFDDMGRAIQDPGYASGAATRNEMFGVDITALPAAPIVTDNGARNASIFLWMRWPYIYERLSN